MQHPFYLKWSKIQWGDLLLCVVYDISQSMIQNRDQRRQMQRRKLLT